LRKIKNFSLIGIFLQYHSIPDSVELARFLVEEFKPCVENEERCKNFRHGFQVGLDILIRLKKYEEVFSILINNKMIQEALLFLKRFKVNFEYLNPEAVINLKSLIKENKKLMVDFLQS
jgi:hypothetical protein